MKTYTIYEAKTHFSELVKRAASGETIRIGAHGKVAVELTTASDATAPTSLRGIWEGKIWYAPDYYQADQEIAALINQGLDR